MPPCWSNFLVEVVHLDVLVLFISCHYLLLQLSTTYTKFVAPCASVAVVLHAQAPALFSLLSQLSLSACLLLQHMLPVLLVHLLISRQPVCLSVRLSVRLRV